MKILVAGGGTGGHIAPIIAVLERIREKDKDAKILYVGSKKGLESKIIPKMDIDFVSIDTGKFRRYHKNKLVNIINPKTISLNAKDLLGAVKGVRGSMAILKKFKPESIFIKGGYVSLPVGIAAKLLGYPFCIHESDTIPGLSNKILSRWAKVILVSYPKDFYEDYFDMSKVYYSGTPVRRDLLTGDKKRGLETFSFDKDIPVLLILGGSQGSMAINDVVKDSLEDLLDKYQVIHITGEHDFDNIQFLRSKLPKEMHERYKVYDFLSSELKDAYATSDLIISRAGNNVLTEIAALKKPSILVPLPSSTSSHQFKNAQIFSREGAAYLMEESKFDRRTLLNQLDYLFEHEEELKYMSEKVNKFYMEDSTDKIVKKIIEIKADREKDVRKKSKKDTLPGQGKVKK